MMSQKTLLNTPAFSGSKKRELQSPEIDSEVKKNKYGSVSSDSELDTSVALDHSVTEPKEPTPLSAMATDSLQDASAVLTHDLEIAQQMSSEAPLSQSHITIPPSEMMKLSQMLKDTFREEIVNMVDSVVQGVIAGLQNRISSLETSNHDLLRENKTLSKRVASLEQQIEQAEQYSRRNCLTISGLEEKAGEVTDDLIMSLASATGSSIQLQDIDRSHRIGDPKKARTRPRDIIVKFASYRSRQNFYKCRSALKDTGYKGVFVNENLTKTRSVLLYEARKLFKSDRLMGAWTSDGTVLVKDNSEKVHRINTFSDLAAFEAQEPRPHPRTKPSKGARVAGRQEQSSSQ